jgi:arsenite methyltransferase
MTSILMRVFDSAFGHPRGLAGRLGGAVMARGNVEQERWAVRRAELRPRMSVLVIGPGPGVGLDLAAARVGPEGRVVGVDPSATMRDLAARRCAQHIASGGLELRDGAAESTGCADASVDVAISVNNVMLWDLPRGFAEMARVLVPRGMLVVTVHRHVLGVPPEELEAAAAAAGFGDITLTQRPRRLNSPAVEMVCRRQDGER